MQICIEDIFSLHPEQRLLNKENMKSLQHNPFYLSSRSNHTMDDASLLKYLEIKVHSMIKNERYAQIVVIGRYDRDSTTISAIEKGDKKYNWQRPTAYLHGKQLFICCYPGRDYVRHYASLISTYLALIGKDPTIVKYCYPSEEESWQAIKRIDLNSVSEKNLLIVGYALDSIFRDAKWAEGDTCWHSQYDINNQPATLLLVKHSFWGDIAGYVARQVAETGFQRLLFIGKLGSLQPDYHPNECLATGTSSLVEGELIQWKTLFREPLPDFVKSGVHISVPSVMYETIPWASIAKKGFDFVDPEIGHMARESSRAGIGFSYLHVVSDNVVSQHSENLSNERDASILAKRAILKQKIAEVILSSIA